MAKDAIVIKGAREHNLRGVDLEIPRDKLVVLTGVSGSGKSSLAFDTLYAEGQRRYVESLSAYARQFLGQMEKPKVDYIGGLSPAIAIEQKSASKNPRSTVGTVTEVYDYMRLLFARIGTQHCHQCGRAVSSQSAEQMVNRVLTLPTGSRFMVLAPMISRRKGEYKDVFAEAKADGYSRVRVDGEIMGLDQEIKLNKKVKHSIEVVIDRLAVPDREQGTGDRGQQENNSLVRIGKAQEAAQDEWGAFVTRLTDAVEQALRLSEGTCVISIQPSVVGEQGPGDGAQGSDGATQNSELKTQNSGEEWLMSEENTCTYCGISFPELAPQMFSFNNPQGACPTCSGLGTRLELDPQLLVPNTGLSLNDGAVPYWGEMRKKADSWAYRCLISIGNHYGFNLDTPWEQLTEQQQQVIIYGSGKERLRFSWSDAVRGSQGEVTRPWEGLAKEINRRFMQTGSDAMREHYTQYMSEQPCPDCRGARLRPETLAVKIGAASINDICQMNIQAAHDWAEGLAGNQGSKASGQESGAEHELAGDVPVTSPALKRRETNQAAHNGNGTSNGQAASAVPVVRGSQSSVLSAYQLEIVADVLKEISDRLGFLLNVGLHYLTMHRSAPTLSGGEAQRIRLASQIGSGLVGVMYILDEPSIGLHQRDNRKLLGTLLKLRDLGNTVIVVEHDLETMQAADYLVDFGPGAGIKGGQVVAAGTPDAVGLSESLTGQYMSGRLEIHIPEQRRIVVASSRAKDFTKRYAYSETCAVNRTKGDPTVQWLAVEGATMNNLRTVSASFPLGTFIAVTGVSGSGKSSLINETLFPALANRLNKAQLKPGPHRELLGLEHLDKVIDIDQQPIGRTPRSNPATYVKLFDLIRELFAQTNEAKIRGYESGRFSFNMKGGRCEACEGNGEKRIDMQFLADVWVQCDVCKGKRYNRETLQVKYKGKSISEVLNMDVQTALEFFDKLPRIRRILQTLHDVGLDYIALGQSSTTLSGGEAQRIKLAKELARVATGRTIYILDEPTTGLHFADTQRLLTVLHRLVDAGNTVLVIEHNLDVVKTADWIIDMGPEGGAGGGELIACGTPEEVAQVPNSYTGEFLREMLLQSA